MLRKVAAIILIGIGLLLAARSLFAILVIGAFIVAGVVVWNLEDE